LDRDGDTYRNYRINRGIDLKSLNLII